MFEKAWRNVSVTSVNGTDFGNYFCSSNNNSRTLTASAEENTGLALITRLVRDLGVELKAVS